jgi:hypothetical protein
MSKSERSRMPLIDSGSAAIIPRRSSSEMAVFFDGATPFVRRMPRIVAFRDVLRGRVMSGGLGRFGDRRDAAQDGRGLRVIREVRDVEDDGVRRGRKRIALVIGAPPREVPEVAAVGARRRVSLPGGHVVLGLRGEVEGGSIRLTVRAADGIEVLLNSDNPAY